MRVALLPAHERDGFWMRRALAEAARGRGCVEPNPMVGAVVVREDAIVGVGHHGRFGGPHAEVVALARAGEAAAGSTLYVTLEPCCHFGKTPPCTEAILRAQVRRVVVAAVDPFPAVSGEGIARLRAAGLEVDVGSESADALRQNRPYFKRLLTGRPYVLAKWAATLDGKIATRTGESAWISNEHTRALVHELRGRMDAIIVGIGTALRDNPRLTARPPGPRTPLRVVLDSQARLPLDSHLAKTARECPVLIAVGAQACETHCQSLRELGCEVVRFGAPRVPISALLDELGRRTCTNVLVEGGGTALGGFFDAGEVDELHVTIAPIILGGAPLHTPVHGDGVERIVNALRLREVRVQVRDSDIRVCGVVPREWWSRAGLPNPP